MNTSMTAKPIEEMQERSRAIVRRLAHEKESAKQWQRPFILARRLRALGDAKPEDYRDAITLFCDETGTPFLDFFAEYLVAWDRVRFLDPFDVAVEAARRQPVSMPIDPPLPQYGVLGSICVHLARETDPEPFVLPRKRIAKEFGCVPKTATNLVRWLEKKARLIRCVDESFQWKRKGEGRCKRYRLIHNHYN